MGCRGVARGEGSCKLVGIYKLVLCKVFGVYMQIVGFACASRLLHLVYLDRKL